MGNTFGSCLGIGRPTRPGTDPHLLGSNLVNVDKHPFSAQAIAKRQSMTVRPAPVNARNAFLPNGLLPSQNGHSPMPKLLRQSSSLNQSSQQQGVSKLVDIDDNPLPQFDKSVIGLQNSHLNCNIKQSQSQMMQQPQNEFTVSPEFKVSPNELKLLIALYDYNPRTHDDLAFNKGDHLETAPKYMHGDWWLARSKTSKNCGYIPSNYVAELKTLGAEKWYFGKIGRQEAERSLRSPGNKNGAFMIRDSDSPTHRYSLSLLHDNGIKHYRIKQFETGGYYIAKKTLFSTIYDLVSHYSEKQDGLAISLGKACVSLKVKPTTYGLTHDTCDRWEIDRSQLEILQELGRGQFGHVYEGLFNKTTRVAIKMLRKDSMDSQDFLDEAQIMKKMVHENLVQLYAVCTREEPIYIVTELMSKGALISYLQTNEGKNLPFADYINMATQISAGMSFIERGRYVHRDLAARNILVGDNNVCKIADFGLARFITETEYEARPGAKFPIKWTAPEAANFSKFTIKSDVWSFGIVLYEIITKGGTPYPDMTNQEVLERIEKGYRMPQPPNCENKYYEIMKKCWSTDPNKRPTFEALNEDLSRYFESDEQYREAKECLKSEVTAIHHKRL